MVSPFAVTLPLRVIKVPGLPPVQVNVKGFVRSIVAAALSLVQTKRGFVKVTVEVNGPTSAPPEPVNVKVPPEGGIAPAARVAPEVPWTNPGASVTASPLGPVRLTEPPSRPAMVSLPPGRYGPTAHPPGEIIPLRPVAPARSPLSLTKAADALFITVVPLALVAFV